MNSSSFIMQEWSEQDWEWELSIGKGGLSMPFSSFKLRYKNKPRQSGAF
jgi:hypothetical protein